MSTVLRPTTCLVCGDSFYAETEWRDGTRVPVNVICGACSAQGELFEVAE